MAVTKKITQPGNNISSSLDGNVQIDDGRSKISISDGAKEIIGLGKLENDIFGFETKDETNIRTFAGEHTTLGDGFYVSKPGFDANTTAATNLIFNSNQNTFKIVKKVSAGFSTSGTTSSALVTLAHNMGYQPMYLATCDITSSPTTTGLVSVPWHAMGTNTGAPGAFVVLQYIVPRFIGNSAITFECGTYTGTFAGTITLYVLQESAA